MCGSPSFHATSILPLQSCLGSPTLRPFVIISLSYLLFTITDGALRMIVLLHANNKGFSAWQVPIPVNPSLLPPLRSAFSCSWRPLLPAENAPLLLDIGTSPFEPPPLRMQVAIMFTLYELAGVVTNFLAGIAGARWGIKSTLLVGLTLQLAGIGMLFGWQDDWSQRRAIVFVTFAQASAPGRESIARHLRERLHMLTPHSHMADA